MSRPLPELIDPLQFAETGREISGQIPLSRFTRISGSLQKGSLHSPLYDKDGLLDVVLQFTRDEHGLPSAFGRISGQLNLTCQRCLQALVWSLDIPVRLAFVRDEKQLAQLPEDCEPVLLPGEPMPLVDLVEDEVILALPQAPVHELSSCPANATWRVFAEGNTAQAIEPSKTATKRQNPFAVLEQLKRK